MPVAPFSHLTPNFQAWELGADKPAATAEIVANCTRVAQYLEIVRVILGVPLIMGDPDTHTSNSGFRPPEDNASVDGSSTSDHMRALSGDFRPKGLSMYRAYNRLIEAQQLGQLPPFDQIIYYPLDGHIHVGLGSRMRGEIRIRLGEKYPILTPDLVDRLPGAVKDAVAEVASAVSTIGLVPLLALLLLVFVLVK